jgi:hypothetical protein
MPEPLNVTELRISVEQLGTDSDRYFEEGLTALSGVSRVDYDWGSVERDHFWAQLPEPLRNKAGALVDRVVTVAGQIAVAIRNAPLVSEADQRDVMTGTKAMRSALLRRRFRSWTTEVLHDEGTVLGVQPAGQSDNDACTPEDARRIFADWKEKVLGILDLVAASRVLTGPEGTGAAPSSSARYRPNTAFIMTWMDASRPELQDVSDAVKEVFAQFDIRAVRADDIEHEDLITQRIIDEIGTAEFLFADLTGERPSVYYEVGYAHALRRRVILVRNAGTGLHFDLAGYNCPEYENLHDLKEKLTRRLVYITGKRPRGAAGASPESDEA